MTTTAGSGALAVRVRGLRKNYQGKAAAGGVDLDIERGTGRDGGEVSVLGADPASAGRDWRARVGIVPQSDWAGPGCGGCPAASAAGSTSRSAS